jgi:hypothetical protein
MATKLHKDVEYLWCMGHWMHVKDLVRVQIFSEIKVQNIQGTHGPFSLKLILIRYIKMDLCSWESLWKVLVTIGVGNLFLFFIIVFVFTINNSMLIWILIAIESACYLGILIVRRRIRQLLR